MAADGEMAEVNLVGAEIIISAPAPGIGSGLGFADGLFHAFQMRVDGTDGDVQPAGHFLGRQTLAQQPEALRLFAGELEWRFFRERLGPGNHIAGSGKFDPHGPQQNGKFPAGCVHIHHHSIPAALALNGLENLLGKFAAEFFGTKGQRMFAQNRFLGSVINPLHFIIGKQDETIDISNCHRFS